MAFVSNFMMRQFLRVLGLCVFLFYPRDVVVQSTFSFSFSLMLMLMLEGLFLGMVGLFFSKRSYH